MTIHTHQYDIPEGLTFSGSVAVDTETMGLNPKRDRLCLVQLSSGDGDAHLVHFPQPRYDAPYLKQLLTDQNITKIFHFARFDIAILSERLHIKCQPVYCTKIASKLARTYTDRHGLQDLCRDLLKIELSKAQQSSDWGSEVLTVRQQEYAAADVLHLHQLKSQLDVMLEREGRTVLAKECFSFISTRATLDQNGWAQEDIFAH